MAMIQDLYYAVWANLSEFSVNTRAAITIAVFVGFIWIVARPLFFGLLRLLFHIAGLLVRLVCLIGGKILAITIRKSPEQYAIRYNQMAEWLSQCNERLIKWSEQLIRKRKFHMGRMLLIYGVLMFLISFPTLFASVVSKEYMPYFSFVSDLYQKLEAPALEAAAAYNPLFSINNGVAEKEKVWLSLSEKGRNGSNVRMGPGTDNQVIGTVAGDMQVLYLEKRNGSWVHICTEDGMEGWIHDSLVTGIPENSNE